MLVGKTNGQLNGNFPNSTSPDTASTSPKLPTLFLARKFGLKLLAQWSGNGRVPGGFQHHAVELISLRVHIAEGRRDEQRDGFPNLAHGLFSG